MEDILDEKDKPEQNSESELVDLNELKLNIIRGNEEEIKKNIS